MKAQTQDRHITRRIIFFLFLCGFLFSLSAVPTEADTVASGVCGDNLTWTLDDTGMLTIIGTGLMDDYNDPHECPWNAKQSLIKSVTISDGVISIGSNAFADCINLSNFVIPPVSQALEILLSSTVKNWPISIFQTLSSILE